LNIDKLNLQRKIDQCATRIQYDCHQEQVSDIYKNEKTVHTTVKVVTCQQQEYALPASQQHDLG